MTARRGALVVGAIAAAYFATFVSYGAFGEDEGLLLIQFARTFRGELPYVDFHTGYPPATFYLNATLFRLFGESVLPLRALLVIVNATSTALLFAIARPLAGPALAATVALGWAAYLPFFGGHFASFNIPYPSWYATCAFLAAQLAFDRHLASGRLRSLVLAGVAAGTAFAFKQNAGALATLACGLVLAIVHAGDRDADRWSARVLLVLGGAFLLLGFTSAATPLESVIVLGPTVLLLTGRVVWARDAVAWPVRLWPAIGCVAAGALAPTIPWMAIFLPVLGIGGIAHEIFLVGTDFDLVYGSPYPLPLGVPQVWPFVVALGLAGASWLGGAAGRRMSPARATAIGTAAGALVLGVLAWSSRMPEGAARAVVLQVQHVGFYAAPILATMLVLSFLRRLRGDGALAVADVRVLALLVFAASLFAELYPRVDTTHLVLAMPSALVLAAWAARRLVARWSTVLGVSRRVLTTAAASVGAVIALAAVVPNLASVIDASGGRPQVAVESTRVPVHVEAERGEDVRALNALLGYLRAHVAPDEPVFAFPAVALVPFALGLRTATPHDYFFAGRPDHLEEAVIVRRLREVSPRWVITLNRRLYFFNNAPAYYFILRDFVRARYGLAARFGRYDVLRRRDVPGDLELRDDFGPEIADDRVLALLADVDGEWRRAGARALVGDAATADAVTARVRRLAPDETSRLLAVRGLGALGDPRAVPYLFDAYETSGMRLRGEAAGALTFVVLGMLDRSHILGGSSDTYDGLAAPVVATLDEARMRAALASDSERARIGVFAAWVATERGDLTAVPLLKDMAARETSRPFLQVAASYALVRLGSSDYVCTLVQMLGRYRHEVQDTVPNYLLGLTRTHPDAVATCLQRGLAQPTRLGREVTAWVSGQAGLPAVAPALEAATRDPEPRVRLAAVWALGMLRDRNARGLLAPLARTSDDPAMRAFAEEALARLDGATW